MIRACVETVSSSPRMWGCFHCPDAAGIGPAVFPTHVGVFPIRDEVQSTAEGLPHACGGVSMRRHWHPLYTVSSPRMWGCFPCPAMNFYPALVFPTHVGVFLAEKDGGGGMIKSSPRMWGCFRKTSSLGYGVHGLPHACGGVSVDCSTILSCSRSSPRMWGCFQIFDALTRSGKVFPTHVGVFPCRLKTHPKVQGLPHACGGVSTVG